MSSSSTRRLIAAGLYLSVGLVFAAESLTSRVIDLGGKGSALVPTLTGLAPALRTESRWDLAYTVLVVCAMVALATLVRGRGERLVTIGAALTLVGNLAHSAVVVIQVMAANMAGQDPAAMARLWDSINSDATLLPIMLMIMVYPLGGIVMAAGFARARIVGKWIVGAWALMTVLDLVLKFPGSHGILAVLAAATVAYTAARIAFPTAPAPELVAEVAAA